MVPISTIKVHILNVIVLNFFLECSFCFHFSKQTNKQKKQSQRVMVERNVLQWIVTDCSCLLHPQPSTQDRVARGLRVCLLRYLIYIFTLANGALNSLACANKRHRYRVQFILSELPLNTPVCVCIHWWFQTPDEEGFWWFYLALVLSVHGVPGGTHCWCLFLPPLWNLSTNGKGQDKKGKGFLDASSWSHRSLVTS